MGSPTTWDIVEPVAPTTLTLISFAACPFVQRSVITLEEKGVPYEITFVDLFDKPAWFLELSPLGKVPVLRVGEVVIFESAVINEYIEETTGGGMHPRDPITRAHNRAWIEFGSTLILDSHNVVTAPTRDASLAKAAEIRHKLRRLDEQIRGPLFNGPAFSLVDAAYAPLLQRLAWYEDAVPEFAFLDDTPKVAAWRQQLFARPAFARSTVANVLDHNDNLMRSLAARAPNPAAVPWYVQHVLGPARGPSPA